MPNTSTTSRFCGRNLLSLKPSPCHWHTPLRIFPSPWAHYLPPDSQRHLTQSHRCVSRSQAEAHSFQSVGAGSSTSQTRPLETLSTWLACPDTIFHAQGLILPSHCEAEGARLRQTLWTPYLQVLLAVYFFLAGCIVNQSRMMWVAPAASASFACLFAAVSHASNMLSSSYRQEPSTLPLALLQLVNIAQGVHFAVQGAQLCDMRLPMQGRLARDVRSAHSVLSCLSRSSM